MLVFKGQRNGLGAQGGLLFDQLMQAALDFEAAGGRVPLSQNSLLLVRVEQCQFTDALLRIAGNGTQ
ncbi:hypothetical protein D3C77_761960 [compost metagenome]